MDTGDDSRDHIDITIGNHGQAEGRRGERQGSEIVPKASPQPET